MDMDWKTIVDWLLKIGVLRVIIPLIISLIVAFVVGTVLTVYLLFKLKIIPTSNQTPVLSNCPGHGSSPVGGFIFDPIGYGSAKVDNDKAIELPNRPNLTNHAFISVEDNPVRIRYDGGDPTPGEGHLIQAGDSMDIHFSNTETLSKFRVISVMGQATIRVTCSNYRK